MPGKYVSHLHLADNTRQEPGTGDIDLVAALRVLNEIKFKGYMAYECGITGNTPREKAKNLAKSLDYVRDCMAKASE
jgi:sugar phosphate isomerase/epimerase